MEVRRIEAGILDNGTDFDMTMTPFEAGLGKFIDFEKENFIGRNALLDVKQASLIFGVRCLDATPLYHGEILDGSKVVAKVTAGAWSPYLNAGVGYARFEEAGDWAGKSLEMKTANGKLVPCEIVGLPFYDAEKLIPRGLDRTIP